jgi:hypothetical protein
MKSEYRQVVKLSSPAELKAYVVHEHELDLLAQGSSVSYLLNFALFCFGVASTAFGTVATVPAGYDKTYYTFLIFAVVALSVGIVLTAIWFVIHKSTANLIAKIKSRMPPNPPIKQMTVTEVEVEETVEGVLHRSDEEREEEED